mgnify:CR=1 FL=1
MQVAEVFRNQHAIISTEAPAGNEGRWAGSLMLWHCYGTALIWEPAPKNRSVCHSILQGLLHLAFCPANTT